jgi:exopolysaccharide production protein ExoY
MERITRCETVDLSQEGEAFAARRGSPATVNSILLSPTTPLSAPPPVESLAVAPATPRVTPKVSRPVRALDLTVAGLILLIALPLMVLCALAIRLTSPGPAIYRQARIGRGGCQFTCFKFRTMIPSAGPALNDLIVAGRPYHDEWASLYKLRADPRVTALGRFLRRFSIDELPQLFNVFRGDMSIVGPRPIVDDEIHRYGERFADYCRVNPGITGLWQVSGRHALTYDERVRLDAEYANNKTLLLDVVILWRTIPVVLFGQNE